MIDLHCHSTCSDGTFTPTELVQIAKEKNLDCLALTDHDTLDGMDELFSAAKSAGLETVTGVEISTSWYNSSLHIIGLFVDPAHNPLLEFLANVIKNRDRRNEKMVRKLRDLGYDITLEECLEKSDGGVLGRPHVASILKEKGYFKDLKSVFNELLATGRPAYVRRYLPMPAEAIKIIHQAGGLAIWAHPYAMRSVSYSTLKKTASNLVSQGLDGVETHYSHFTDVDQENINRFVAQTPLLHSGGSDFHGANSPGVELGTGIDGNIAVPYELITAMKQKLGR